jgi:hypothetical protein
MTKNKEWKIDTNSCNVTSKLTVTFSINNYGKYTEKPRIKRLICHPLQRACLFFSNKAFVKLVFLSNEKIFARSLKQKISMNENKDKS